MRTSVYLSLLSLSFLVSCGGGTTVSTDVTTTVSNITTNTTGATFSSGVVSSMSPVNNQSSTVKITRNAASKIIKMEFTNGLGTTSLSTSNGDTIEEVVLTEGSIVSGYSSDSSKQVFYVADSNMAIGTWYKVDGSTGYSSVAHTGTKTSADPVTIITNATYNGILIGTLSENGFTPVNTIADLTAIANFTTKSMTINSTGTYAIDSDGTNLGAYNTQNFSATITDANSDNVYEGNVTDAEGKTGTLNVTLYGSAANSVGGVGTTANGANTRVHQFAFAGDR